MKFLFVILAIGSSAFGASNAILSPAQTTSFSRTLLAAPTAADARATLGAITGSGVDPSDFAATNSALKAALVATNAAIDAKLTNLVTDAPFTIAIIPDTQKMTVNTNTARMVQTFKWLETNRVALNLAAVVGVGDCVEYYGREATAWATFFSGINQLTNTPILVSAGNHDEISNGTGRDYSGFNANITRSFYTGKSWFNGGFMTNNSQTEAYLTITNGSTKLLLFTVEFLPKTNQVQWVSNVCAQFPQHYALLATHNYLLPSGERAIHSSFYSTDLYGITDGCNGEDIWQLMRGVPNLRMIVCGHQITLPYESHTLAFGDSGNWVNQVFVNYQDLEISTGEAVSKVKLLTFYPAKGKIDAQTFDGELLAIDATNRYEMPFAGQGQAAEPFEIVAGNGVTLSNVATTAGAIGVRKIQVNTATQSNSLPMTWVGISAVTNVSLAFNNLSQSQTLTNSGGVAFGSISGTNGEMKFYLVRNIPVSFDPSISWAQTPPTNITNGVISFKAFGSKVVARYEENVAGTEITNGLVGWWKFNETSGTNVADSSGQNNAGRIVGTPTWTNSSMLFDGATYITLTNSASLQLTNPITICAWVKLSTGARASRNTIFSTSDDSTGFWLETGTPNYAGSMSIVKPSTFISNSSTNVISENVWQFCAYTRLDYGLTHTFYVNGSDVGTYQSFTNGFPSVTTSKLIGARTPVTQRLSATMDDLRIYNRVLSAAEIQFLYENGPK